MGIKIQVFIFKIYDKKNNVLFYKYYHVKFIVFDNLVYKTVDYKNIYI